MTHLVLEPMHVHWMKNCARDEKICVCGASRAYGEVLLSSPPVACLYAKSTLKKKDC